MARFGQQFLSQLGNPAGMLQGAADLGGAIGGIGGQVKEKRILGEEAKELKNSGFAPGTAGYLSIQARQATRRGDKKRATELAALAQQEKNTAATLKLAQERAGREEERAGREEDTFGQSQAKRTGILALSRYVTANNQELDSEKVRKGFFTIANVHEIPIDEAIEIYETLEQPSFLTAKQKGDFLLNGFKSENIEQYATTGISSDLGVPDKDVREGMTSFEKTMNAAGIEKGSEEWTDLSKKYANRLADGEIKTLSLSEQISMVSKDLASNPMLKISEKNSAQSRKALATIREAKNLRKEGKPVSEMERVIERTVSELYNADTRSVQEIQRFLEGKGLPRTAADWIGSGLAGEITDESLNALEGLATLVNEISQREIDGLVNGYLSLYDGIIDKKGIQNVRNRYAQGYSLTTQRQIDKAKAAQGN